MNFRILTLVLFLIILVPVISTITAQEVTSELNINKPSVKIIQDDNFRFYAFVQIIHRDSDGNLLSYIESDKIGTLDNETIIELINTESSRGQDPKYSVNGDFIEVIVRQQVTQIETTTLSTDSQLISNSNDKDGKEIISLRIFHDGYMAYPGDVITTNWNFVKII
jgi:hypothetical protein|tara:strand:+ start:2516 stop:3013 length:498 start_codon:yes stop_codon:yes gene_type:complete